MTNTYGVYCGCYYCLKHFPWEQIEIFIDGEYLKGQQERWFGETIKLGDLFK